MQDQAGVKKIGQKLKLKQTKEHQQQINILWN